ncbi:MAG: carbamoyl-phosphate synthase large subunit, partial [Lentisphaeria bacterium]|nr:carbamoyl-phosphate synthase large subunit [Lentisphaeria bacterium]
MPKRTDIQKILLIGSGPIVIGQGCEFDYSGVQACKVLKQDGFEVVLVNSNPATVMTDPELADRTYIEPLTCDILHEIIRRERPDAILPTLGGQTALNLAMELNKNGILKRYHVELIGASADAIARAEDRQLFKKTMQDLGLDLPQSGSAHSESEADAIARTIGTWPLIIRPGFTLGGTGGGIAHDEAEFREIVRRGLEASLNHEVLIEESLLGWKEFEMEVMRDKKGSSVIVCSIENLDPMGVHTGDSITVAPIQTLTDREYQEMRDDSLRVLAAIGVETGGSNVQWAVNPDTGRRIIIEMNPRVSRSSALASKATGFPIAKIAAKLAVGYTLDELRNDITGSTPSCFEPALDYIVTKIPRFTFEKFPAADPTLGTQMKSVGEVMAIGRNFKQSLQKALRSLETGRAGFGADGKDATFESASDEMLEEKLVKPNAERIFWLRAAFKRGWDVEKVFSLTQIDRFFLRHLRELAMFEDEIASTGTLDNLAAEPALFKQAKEFGYSDRQIAFLLHATENEVAAQRRQSGLLPSFGAVDTCAGEFEAITPYYYS